MFWLGIGEIKRRVLHRMEIREKAANVAEVKEEEFGLSRHLGSLCIYMVSEMWGHLWSPPQIGTRGGVFGNLPTTRKILVFACHVLVSVE